MYISCRTGWKILREILKLLLMRVLMKILDASFHLNHHPFLIWKSSQSLFFRIPWRLPMKLQQILNLISSRLSLSSIKVILIMQRLINIQRRATLCVHTDRPLYCKGMCNYCYHKHGRPSMSTMCPHTDKKAYCRGMCTTCYQRWKMSRSRVWVIKKLKNQKEG